VVHRDLKSHNVLVASDGSTRVCDFGLVRTRNTTAGTPAYMAPELLSNGVFSGKVDVYAFGVLLWEIYHAEVPWRSHDAGDIMQAVGKGDRPEINEYDCAPAVVDLIRACWHADPARRPTFRHVVDDLRDIEAKVPAVVHSDCVGGGDALDALLG